MMIFATATKANFFLALFTLAAIGHAPAASAGAWKCKTANGKVVISSVQCADDAKTLSVHQPDNITESQRQAAIADLQRQKAFAAKAEKTRNSGPGYTVQRNADDTQNNLARIDKCLMGVSATTGLDPAKEAYRKVRCFEGSRGLAQKCEYSVASTSRLNK